MSSRDREQMLHVDSLAESDRKELREIEAEIHVIKIASIAKLAKDLQELRVREAQVARKLELHNRYLTHLFNKQ